MHFSENRVNSFYSIVSLTHPSSVLSVLHLGYICTCIPSPSPWSRFSELLQSPPSGLLTYALAHLQQSDLPYNQNNLLKAGSIGIAYKLDSVQPFHFCSSTKIFWFCCFSFCPLWMFCFCQLSSHNCDPGSR